MNVQELTKTIYDIGKSRGLNVECVKFEYALCENQQTVYIWAHYISESGQRDCALSTAPVDDGIDTDELISDIIRKMSKTTGAKTQITL